MDEVRQDDILERLLARQTPPPQRGRLWLALVVLLIVGCWTMGLNQYDVPILNAWDMQDPGRLVYWVLQVTVRYTLHGLVFLLLGLLIPGWVSAMWRQRPAVSERSVRRTRNSGKSSGQVPTAAVSAHVGDVDHWGRALTQAAWLSVHAALAVFYFLLVLTVSGYLFGALAMSWGLKLSSELAVAVLGLLTGAWLGLWIPRGWHGVGRLATHAVAIMLFIGLASVWLVTGVMESEPLPFEKVTINTADKRALVDAAQNPAVRVTGERVYRASEEDLNKLLAWWIDADRLDGKARVQLGDHSQRLQLSLRYPPQRQPRSYANLAIGGRCQIVDQQLQLDLDSLRLGAISIPYPVINWMGRMATDWLAQQSESLEMLSGILFATADQHGVQLVVADDGRHNRRLAKLLRQVGDHPDVTRPVSIQLREFAQIVSSAGRKEPLFDKVVRAAFERAADRSRHIKPVEANRAAILALGIGLGHINIERYVGDCFDAEVRLRVYRLPSHSQLRGRSDWSRHFWVSAALTLLTSNHVSDAAGLLKEELDADVGGSGFSFGDLMADRAGTEFARAATSRFSIGRGDPALGTQSRD